MKDKRYIVYWQDYDKDELVFWGIIDAKCEKEAATTVLSYVANDAALLSSLNTSRCIEVAEVATTSGYAVKFNLLLAPSKEENHGS